jgi:hypothetical protein
MFTRLFVLLDSGAFGYALEWATRLRLPLHGVVLPAAGGVPAHAEHRAVAAGVQASVACARAGVAWQLCRWDRNGTDRLDRLVGPGDLVVFGNAMPAASKKRWLRQLLHETLAALLLCPGDWTPPRRLLVLQEGSLSGKRVLEAAESLCRDLPAAPVVLTLGVTLQAARHRQEVAREVLASRGLNADFDLIVGWNVREAVLSAVGWRRCQLAIIERPRPVPWWRAFWGTPTERMLYPPAPVAFLVLPEGAEPGQAPGPSPPADGRSLPRDCPELVGEVPNAVGRPTH